GSTDPPQPSEVLVVGLARNDESPRDQSEGDFAFFFDLEADRFLSGTARVNNQVLDQSFLPGVKPGPLYFNTAGVVEGRKLQLVATIAGTDGTIEVTSDSVRVPTSFSLTIPTTHTIGQPLPISWGATPDAEQINISVGSGFETDVPASQRSFTIPASAFTGLTPGQTIEIEVSAFNVFYISLATGISDVQDAEAFAERFRTIDNINGAMGAFGAATTVGALVALQ
ncbi:MAG: hypothetical protein ABR559_09875, partial [Gemmatimonadota bacterium]